MRIVLVGLCLLGVVYCQTQHKNGNPTGEIGQPAFDEIIVESTLTVRGKSGTRSGKSLITSPQNQTPEPESKPESADGAGEALGRTRREPRQRHVFRLYSDRTNSMAEESDTKFGGFAEQILGGGPFGFPSSSSSAAHASSNAFNSNTPFGSFGASASQSSGQSQSFGPSGFQGSAGQSASQTYHLPNGNRIDISFSSAFNINNGKPSASNSHSFTVTGPDGRIKGTPLRN